MTRTRHTNAGRRRLAVAALLLWVLGFEVAPGLHVGLHELLAPHSHSGREGHAHGNKPRVRVSFGQTHTHGGSTHSHEMAHGSAGHADERAPRRRASDRPELESPAPSPVDHGAHALAHRGMATMTPGTALALPSLRPGPSADDPPPIAAALPEAELPLTRQRGPPRA